MARPKLSSTNRRAERINARCTPEQLRHIKQRAAAAKMTVSEFVIQAATGAQIKTARTPKADPTVISHLLAIGNNLNQMARKFNATDRTPPPELREVLTVLRTLVFKHLG